MHPPTQCVGGFLRLCFVCLQPGPAAIIQRFYVIFLVEYPSKTALVHVPALAGGTGSRVIDNAGQRFLTMLLAWCAVRGLVWAKKTENGRLRRFHGTVLAFIALEYALWTASCFWVSDTLTNPYFWFDFLLTLVLLLFLPAVRKAVEA